MGIRLAGKTFVLVLCSALGSCNSWWDQKVVFPSPLSGTALEIQQPFPTNGWGMRVVLKTSPVTKVLYEVRGDVFLDFADGVWSANGTMVALFTCGTPPVKIAYDVDHGVDMAFANAQSMIAAHIRSSYHLDTRNATDKDAFEWACSSEGRSAFLRAYPGALAR